MDQDYGAVESFIWHLGILGQIDTGSLISVIAGFFPMALLF